MIKKIKDLDAIYKILSSIDKENPESIEIEMESEIYNDTLETIENKLNRLYEKTRLLEEYDDYCNAYIRKEIKNRKDIFKERLKIIEDVSDVYRDTDFVAILVKFLPCTETITDRDGEKIPYMEITNNCLEVPGTIIREATISAIVSKSDSLCYNNTYSNLTNKKSGVSNYITEIVVPGGIKEKDTATIKDPNYYNYISIVPINSKLKNIKTINSTQTEEDVLEMSTYIEGRYLTGIKFDLICENYKPVKVEHIDSEEYKAIKDFGQKNFIYERMLNENTLYEMKNGKIEKDNLIKANVLEKELSNRKETK